MGWYYLIYGIVLCGVTLSLVDNERTRQNFHRLYFPAAAVVLTLFAGLRGANVDRDYQTYLDWFHWIAAGDLVPTDWVKDPAFVLVCYIAVRLGLGYTVVTLFYAGAALATQLYFSWMMARPRWLTLFFYLVIATAFIGSEMTQTRAAVAIPLMSIAVLLAYRGEKRKALLLCLVAITFHLSAVIGLPALVLAWRQVEFRSRWWIVSLLPAALVAKAGVQTLLGPLTQVARVSVYLNGGYSTETVRLLSVYFLVRLLAVAFVTAFYWKRLAAEYRLAVFCSSLGLFIQVALSFNDALALRGAAIFFLFDVCALMVPLDYLKGHFRVLYMALLLVVGFVFFHSTLKIIDPYQWIFG